LLPPPGKSGKYQGMDFANVHPMIGNLCVSPEGAIDHFALAAYHETFSLDDLYRAFEVDTIARVARLAAEANARG
jgi:hypothetical protein